MESLRQPLEQGEVSLRRTGGETAFPARIQLVLAANPCPCAKPAGDPACECTALARRRYLARLSGPLLDRIDIQVTLEPLTTAALLDESAVSESSALVADRVAKARAAAVARWAADGWRNNAEVPGAALRSPAWRLPRSVLAPVRQLLDRGELSARGYDRVVRLAWTVADLAGRARPNRGDVCEATELRRGELG